MIDNNARNAVVTYVVDGDTFDAEVYLGYNVKTTARFRLLGIDTAEMRDGNPSMRAKAIKGKQYTKTRLLGKTISIHTEGFKKDSFGRYLGTVFIDGKDYNAELLDTGLAEVYKR